MKGRNGIRNHARHRSRIRSGSSPLRQSYGSHTLSRWGFDSLWVGEHIVVPDYEPKYTYTSDGRLPQPPTTDFPDPLIWLAHAGA